MPLGHMALSEGTIPPRNETLGAREAASWLSARGLQTTGRWSATMILEHASAIEAPRLRISIEALEWGFCFCQETKLSWVRVLDAPCIQERDDFDLLPRTPALRNLAQLVHWIEDTHVIRFRRAHATVHTTLKGAEDKIRLWLVAAL